MVQLQDAQQHSTLCKAKDLRQRFRPRSYSDPNHGALPPFERFRAMCHRDRITTDPPQAAQHLIDAANTDVVLCSCEFLVPGELAKLAATNHRLKSLAQNCYLWRELCLSLWRLDKVSPMGRAIIASSLRDYVHLYPSIEQHPQGFSCPAADTDVRGSGELIQAESSCGKTALQVQYTGGLGLGNRCVRTDLPLPSTRTWERTSMKARHLARCNSSGRGPMAFLQRLMKLAASTPAMPGYGGAPIAAATAAAAAAAILSADTSRIADSNGKDAVCVPMPFSVPTLTSSGGVDVKPRLISYFEVTISAAPGASPHGVPECVAVGLSAERFLLKGRMPGWDALSYGYHSDDGGVFHNSGGMLYQFGPKFAAGDVVGCGLDYNQGAGVAADIFFTLNGKYLGVAFAGVHAGSLYPTVGLDSAAPVRINLGSAPFEFDLLGHSATQSAAAETAREQNSQAQAAKRKSDAANRHNTAMSCAPFFLGAAAIPMMARAYAEHGL